MDGPEVTARIQERDRAAQIGMTVVGGGGVTSSGFILE